MFNVFENILRPIDKLVKPLTAPIDTEKGALNNLPDFYIRLFVFMSASAIVQAIADTIIEISVFFEVAPFYLPFRIEFLSLTLISTVIAYLTLTGLREGNLDVTRNTMMIGLLVESSLLIGDLYFLLVNFESVTKSAPDQSFILTAMIRLPFMILTSINIYIILYGLIRQWSIRRSRPKYRF